MSCPNCGGESPDTAKFCSQCGAALTTACAQCGQINPRASRFCAECGGALGAPALEPRFASPREYTPRPLAERILRDRSAMEGEYKQVTVLFTDVAGFTALAETLDPETVYTLMQQCFDRMLAEVHRYEGTVTQFLGDGILALFGAPIAHEDHGQRAVHAALGIQQALLAYQQELQERRGIGFLMRIGLNSGLVVVGAIGTDLNMTYTALGDTVNLGDRVRALAEPGTVVISPSTHRLVSGYFVTRALGEHHVKGKEQAVSVFEVLRPRRSRSRVDVSADRGLTPLVGRGRELERLLEQYAAARAGRGQVVLLQGEAGLGKSRLLHEFKQRLEGEDPSYYEGRCISFGQDIPYLPIIHLLKGFFETEERDAEAAIIAKVEAGVRALGSELASSQPFLKSLLAVDPGEPAVATMDAQMRKIRTFEALRELLLAAARDQPLVLAVEDLHWIDPLSEEFLAAFAEELAEHPILLLLTARRGYEPRAGFPPSLTSIALEHLSERESATVAQGLLGVAEIPAELQELIARKAEGNPFFVEEVTKSLVEVGAMRRAGDRYVLARRVEEIVVPDTVQDVIMARLDRLPEEPKRALQTASVIGREFTARLLERTAEVQGQVEAYLRELQAVELIFERALHPELAYMFKHALTHDVAYHSLLMARRKVLHRLVGETIEALYRDRLAEQYETLAHHYELAEAWEKAVAYLLLSGEKALAAFAPQQALHFYNRVLAVLEKTGLTLPAERAIALHFGRGQALFVSSDMDHAADSFRAMAQAAHEAGDALQEGMALFQTSYAYVWGHRFEEALEYAERGRQLALQTNDLATLAGSLVSMGLVSIVTGDLPQARVTIQQALTAARQSASPLYQVLGLIWAAGLDQWRGDHLRAIESYEEAAAIARQHQMAQPLVSVGFTLGISRCGAGHYEQALRSLQEGLMLSVRLGDKLFRCRSLNTLGWVYSDLCHWELAIQSNTQAIQESRALGDPETIRNAEINLGDCYLALGQLDEAQRTLEAVYQDAQQHGAWGETWMKWRYTQHLNASLGEVWLARGDAAKALTFAEACLTSAAATASPRNIVKGRRLKGEAFLAQGRLDDAETELAAALHVAREVGNPAQLRLTLAALGRLRREQGQPEEARAAYQEALTIMEGVAASLSDAGVRETVLGSPQVAALRAALAAASA